MRLLSSALCILAATALAAAEPAPVEFPRSTPEAQGIASAALLQFVEEAEQKLDALHSLMVVRHGHVVAEGWWKPYAAGEPHMMFSLSKSFTSTAVGLAVAEGKLKVDDPVLQFFPEEAPAEPGDHLKAMRVRDLLTMTTGHHDEEIRGFPYNGDEDPVKKFLALPVAHKPGTYFVYNTPASYVLSAIVQKVTGQTVLEYLRPRLFEPLGIASPTWQASRHGVSMGGFGLSVRTEDIARFGQLYLQNGRWQGRQLVPADWVQAATSRQVSNGSSPSSDWEQGYGYQFWRSRHGFFRGDGAHGQFCLILPQYDTVIAITSGTRDMGSVMNLVWDRLVPALQKSALPADPSSHRKLTARLASLQLAPQGGRAPALARSLAGKRYLFEKGGQNRQALESITIEAMDPDGGAILSLRVAGADQRIVATPGAWKTSTLRIAAAPEPQPVAASGGWSAPDTYTLELVFHRTPFTTTYSLRFGGELLLVRSETNVGAPDSRVSEFAGALAPTATASGAAAR